MCVDGERCSFLKDIWSNLALSVIGRAHSGFDRGASTTPATIVQLRVLIVGLNDSSPREGSLHFVIKHLSKVEVAASLSRVPLCMFVHFK